MGTFILPAALSAVSAVGVWKRLPGVPPCDTNLLAGINAAAGQGDCSIVSCTGLTTNDPDYLLRMGYNFSSNIIALDGGPLISFESLPSGFRVLSRTVSAIVSTNFFGGPLSTFLQFDEFTEQAVSVPMPSANLVVSYTNTDPLQSVTDLFSNGYGIRITGIGGTTGIFLFRAGKINGIYDIFSSSITITPDPATNGNEISVEADGDLDDIMRIKVKDENDNTVQTIESADFTVFTVILIRFILDISPMVSGTYSLLGTTFTGSVLLGFLEILVENGSGIYRIVTNKRNDTVYLSSAESPTTVDVKIPNPFGKTGFIGG